jgi:hypothetical protein
VVGKSLYEGVADDELAVSEQLFSLAMSAPPKQIGILRGTLKRKGQGDFAAGNGTPSLKSFPAKPRLMVACRLHSM